MIFHCVLLHIFVADDDARKTDMFFMKIMKMMNMMMMMMMMAMVIYEYDDDDDNNDDTFLWWLSCLRVFATVAAGWRLVLASVSLLLSPSLSLSSSSS